MTNNLDELFSPTLKIEEKENKRNGEYIVSADKGKSGVYQSIIRFIPWWKDPGNSVKNKFTCWLVDPLTNKGRYVDDPSSINEPSILNETYWKLKNSDSAALVQQAERFSRKLTYAALIQVIKDDNQPDLNGKILVWRFGKKVWDKINAERNPPIGDPKNPFDLINGRYFALKITKVSGFNNYDNSQFVDFKTPGLQMFDDNGTVEIVTATSDRNKVLEYLKANSPDLNEYGFKPWTKDVADYVNHVVSLVLNQASVPGLMANVVNGAPHTIATTTTATTVNTNSVQQINPNAGLTMSESLDDLNAATNAQLSNLNIDDLNLGDIGQVNKVEDNTPSSSPMGNLDDIFNQI